MWCCFWVRRRGLSTACRRRISKSPSSRAPQFYYFQISPFVGQQPAMLTDTIKSAVSRLGGKTIVIHTPGEFAKAIDRLEKGGRGSP